MCKGIVTLSEKVKEKAIELFIILHTLLEMSKEAGSLPTSSLTNLQLAKNYLQTALKLLENLLNKK